MTIVFNCDSCQCMLTVSGESGCNIAICPKCGNQTSIPTKSSSVISPDEGSAMELGTFFVVHVAQLDEARFPTFDQRCQLLKDIDADFKRRFPNVLNKKPSAIVDKSSNHVTLNYETVYISWDLFDQVKDFLASAFRPYESPPARKILMLLVNGFWETEYLNFGGFFDKHGYDVKTVVPIGKHVTISSFGYVVESGLSPEDVRIDDYDAVVIPEGYLTRDVYSVGRARPEVLKQNKRLAELIKKALKKGKVVAAVCGTSSILYETDVLRKRRVTCNRNQIKALEEAGAIYEDKDVVVDGNLVTTSDYRILPQLCVEVLKLLQTRKTKRSFF